MTGALYAAPQWTSVKPAQLPGPRTPSDYDLLWFKDQGINHIQKIILRASPLPAPQSPGNAPLQSGTVVWYWEIWATSHLWLDLMIFRIFPNQMILWSCDGQPFLLSLSSLDTNFSPIFKSEAFRSEIKQMYYMHDCILDNLFFCDSQISFSFSMYACLRTF